MEISDGARALTMVRGLAALFSRSLPTATRDNLIASIRMGVDASDEVGVNEAMCELADIIEQSATEPLRL